MSVELAPIAAFVVCGAIAIGVLFVFTSDIRYATRHGPVAIRQFVERRGQRVVHVSTCTLVLTDYDRGLSKGSVIFDAVAETSQGERRTYRLAYDPTGSKGGNTGLKQCANGVWHDASYL